MRCLGRGGGRPAVAAACTFVGCCRDVAQPSRIWPLCWPPGRLLNPPSPPIGWLPCRHAGLVWATPPRPPRRRCSCQATDPPPRPRYVLCCRYADMVAANPEATETAVQLYSDCVRWLLLVAGGYECHEAEGTFMVAFQSTGGGNGGNGGGGNKPEGARDLMAAVRWATSVGRGGGGWRKLGGHLPKGSVGAGQRGCWLAPDAGAAGQPAVGWGRVRACPCVLS